MVMYPIKLHSELSVCTFIRGITQADDMMSCRGQCHDMIVVRDFQLDRDS